jgi:hypothetical protein
MTRVAFTIVIVAMSPSAYADDEAPPLSVYGFARLDVLADDTPMSDITKPVYVTMGRSGAEMTMTPQLSQVGLSIDKWELSNHVDGEGKLEIDFAGGGGVNAIRLRHAYGSITYREHLEILAGQTWDLISPLNPSVQNDTMLLGAGNTGDRRPQLRLTAENEHVRVAMAGAVTGTFDGMADAATMPTAMQTTKPMFQWLVEARGRADGDMTNRIGVWGHAARDEELDGTRRGSESVGMHAFASIAGRGAIYGELYSGINTADIGGGLGQGISPITGRGIHSTGGWVEVAMLTPHPRLLIAGGASVDVARGSDLGDGERQTNSVGYGVIRYNPKPTIRIGIEYLQWRTMYKDVGNALANRVDFHTTVFF